MQVRDIEQMAVADSVKTMRDFGSAYDNARMLLPRKLQCQMKEQLSALNVYNVLAELKGYNDVKEDTFRVVLGVLCMLGRLRKDFKDWQSIKPQLRSELFGEMVALDISGAAGANSTEHTVMRKRWAESLRATKGCVTVCNGT